MNWHRNSRIYDDSRIRTLETAQALLKQALESHFIDCRDRYLATERALGDLKEQIRTGMAERATSSAGIYRLLWQGLVGLVVLLLSIIGYLVSKGGLPGPGHP